MRDLTEMDAMAFLNIRNWVENALKAQGAKVTGAGVGCGQADIDIEVDSGRFNVSIKPRPLPKKSILERLSD